MFKLKLPLSITVDVDALPGGDGLVAGIDAILKVIKPLGYMGVQVNASEPESINARELNERLASYQMKVSAVETAPVFTALGLSLGSPRLEDREKAVERFGVYAGLASELEGQPKVLVSTARGWRAKGQAVEEHRAGLIASLEAIDDIAGNLGVQAVLVPVNRFECGSIHDVREATRLLEDGAFEHVFLGLDSFHAHVEEEFDTFIAQVATHARVIKHVHLAGCNRREPAAGCFNFRKLIRALVENGYWGFFNVNAVMLPSLDAVARRAVEYLEKIT